MPGVAHWATGTPTERSFMSTVVKARNWVAVLYPENMIPHWQDRIYRKLQLPFEFIIHDKDTVEIEENENEPRKVHVHLIVHWPGPTTYKNAMETFRSLSRFDDFPCLNKCEPVRGLQFIHRYLTHETEDCKKACKFVYPRSSIISGNNWDLGAFIELEDNDSLLMYDTFRNFMIVQKVRCVIDLEDVIVSDYFNQLLPDFDVTTLRKYVKNNRRVFEGIAKEVNFKFFKKKEESSG